MLTKFFSLALLIVLTGCGNLLPVPTAGAAAGPSPLGPVDAVRSEQPLASFAVEQKAYAEEDKDFGTTPFSSLIPVRYEARTPLILPGAKRITTYELHQLMSDSGQRRPILVNVLPGTVSEAIAGSVWLSRAGEWGRMDDAIQTQLAARLAQLTADDKKRALAFYCLGIDCWHSFNAGIRAIALGYRNVHWYRGGLRAWYAAGLPTTPTEDDSW